MFRNCTFCDTQLPGKRGHGFVTDDGGISCGRSATQKTVIRNGAPSLVAVPLSCAARVKGR